MIFSWIWILTLNIWPMKHQLTTNQSSLNGVETKPTDATTFFCFLWVNDNMMQFQRLFLKNILSCHSVNYKVTKIFTLVVLIEHFNQNCMKTSFGASYLQCRRFSLYQHMHKMLEFLQTAEKIASFICSWLLVAVLFLLQLLNNKIWVVPAAQW